MAHIDFPQSRCLAGLARRDITPPVGIYHRMWGAATHDRSTGVHRPLTATALAVAPEAPVGSNADVKPQVLVSLDHCLLWSDELKALRDSACGMAGIHAGQLHLAFSHTHAAGLMDPTRSGLAGGELIAPYLASVAEKVAQAATEAIAMLDEADVVYGIGHCALATHRDFWDETNRLYPCGFNPHGSADDTVMVARVANRAGRCLATIVNYACHPTTLAWDNTLISPDYVGAMREVVESACGAPCLFLQGASGDLGPRHGFVGDVAIADRNGRQLGYAALAALEGLPEAQVRFEYAGPVISGATIGTWRYRPLTADAMQQKRRWRSERFEIALPYRAELPSRDEALAQLAEWQAQEREAIGRGDAAAARDCRAQVERSQRLHSRLSSLPQGDKVPLAVWLLQLGDAIWLTVAGEHYQWLQCELRRRFPGVPIIVSTVTDGWQPGYLPTAETYGKGIYQESIAVVAPGSLEHVAREIGDRIASWGLASA